MHHVTIYYNPDCGTSRNVLALIRHAGIEPKIILYLQNPPDKLTLKHLLHNIQKNAHDILRCNVEPYEKLGLHQRQIDEDELISLMVQYPLLINRPIVISEKGTLLCRPSETVLQLLPPMPAKAFYKEDGEQILDEFGQYIQR